MNSFGITGWEQIILGIYLIAHGGIHLIFLFYFEDNKTKIHTGWSKQSWLLDKLLSAQLTKYVGYATWTIIAFFFIISGLVILDLLSLNELLPPLLITISLIAIIGFLVFYNGLSPSPYHWILGVVIDACILFFILFFTTSSLLLVTVLLLVWLWGMIFHTKVINYFLKSSLVSNT